MCVYIYIYIIIIDIYYTHTYTRMSICTLYVCIGRYRSVFGMYRSVFKDCIGMHNYVRVCYVEILTSLCMYMVVCIGRFG